MNKKIKLGKYTIHVSIINGVRMVKYFDVIELLKLKLFLILKNLINLYQTLINLKIYIK